MLSCKILAKIGPVTSSVNRLTNGNCAATQRNVTIVVHSDAGVRKRIGILDLRFQLIN